MDPRKFLKNDNTSKNEIIQNLFRFNTQIDTNIE